MNNGLKLPGCVNHAITYIQQGYICEVFTPCDIYPFMQYCKAINFVPEFEIEGTYARVVNADELRQYIKVFFKWQTLY